MDNQMVEIAKALGIKLNENFSDVINRLSTLWKEMCACKNFTDDELKTYTEMLNTQILELILMTLLTIRRNFNDKLYGRSGKDTRS